MNQAEEFFLDLKEWSARKLVIIEKYIGGFSRILGSKSKEIYYVDGFAGKGVYDGGEKGSPVLAAEAAQRFQQANSAFTLRCINVERDPNNYTDLCRETQKFGGLVRNYEGTFEDNIGNILPQTKNTPAVFFIDPFGVKGTRWEFVEQVIARKDPTDIWIRFDHVTVRRLAGFYESDAKDASGKLQALQDLFGITDRKILQTKLESGSNSEERIRNAIALYIEQLEKAFAKHNKKGFAASYPIVSLDGQRKYHLIFACSSYKAATLASNIVNGVEETFQREQEEYKDSQRAQMSLFPSQVTQNQVFSDKVKSLKKSLLNLPKNNPLKREELHYQLLIQDKIWFGKIGKKHLTQALKELLDEAPTKIKSTGAPGSEESIFTILE